MKHSPESKVEGFDLRKIDWMKVGKRTLFPPVWLICILDVISVFLLVYIFMNGMDTHPLACVAYVLAFYSLTVTCAALWLVLPGMFKSAKQKVYENKFGNRYMTDVVFKTQVSLYRSFGINLLYVALNLILGYTNHSAWFYILSGYYTILAVMRFLLLKYVRGNSIWENMLGEWKRARICSCVLTLINLVLSGAILMIMYQNRGFNYHGMLIYVMAAYTFYITTMAIINMVRYRKYKSPVMMITKIITLAAALVSMLSLETAMLTTFGADTSPETKRILIAATGAGIAVTVTALSSYMIVRSTKEIEKLKEVTDNE